MKVKVPEIPKGAFSVQIIDYRKVRRKRGDFLEEFIHFASTTSFEISLRAIREGRAGLSDSRQRLLCRIPNTGDYANVRKGEVSHHDLAYLCAATGHEFALLSGKKEDIVFHGTNGRCVFSDELTDMLLTGKLRIDAHTHPGEENPTPSPEDRDSLKKIGQISSYVISGITGREVVYTQSPFDILTGHENNKEE